MIPGLEIFDLMRRKDWETVESLIVTKGFEHYHLNRVIFEHHPSDFPGFNSNQFRSSPKSVHSPLQAILKVSREFFETEDLWLRKEINFIDEGSLASKHAFKTDVITIEEIDDFIQKMSMEELKKLYYSSNTVVNDFLKQLDDLK